MQVQNLKTELCKMDHESLMEKIRQVREGRVMPIQVEKTKVRKRQVKAQQSVAELFKKMTEKEKEEFIKALGSKK